MKKILMILLAVSLAISLIACGESAELPSLAEISAFSDQQNFFHIPFPSSSIDCFLFSSS